MPTMPSKKGPSLVDLGEEYVAILWNNGEGAGVDYQKYDKNTRTVLSQTYHYTIWDEMSTSWAVNGVVYYTKTKREVEVVTSLKNQDPLDPSGPNCVTDFHVTGYWLKPNASGDWMPESRKGTGDTPWAITYKVTDWWP